LTFICVKSSQKVQQVYCINLFLLQLFTQAFILCLLKYFFDELPKRTRSNHVDYNFVTFAYIWVWLIIYCVLGFLHLRPTLRLPEGYHILFQTAMINIIFCIVIQHMFIWFWRWDVAEKNVGTPVVPKGGLARFCCCRLQKRRNTCVVTNKHWTNEHTHERTDPHPHTPDRRTDRRTDDRPICDSGFFAKTR
jgi:hypothetical protein